MIDTIVLTLDSHQFEILDPGRFSPSAAGLLSPPYYPVGGRGVFRCVQNPTKADFEAGRYLPRLTLAKRIVRGGFALTLRIEFSAPKLIYGNNFDELRSRDFDAVVDVLVRSLAIMGVRVTDPVLRAAPVSAVHYGKNIALTDYTTCSMVMSELDLIDLNKRLDLSHTDFRNEGQAIRYHASSFEVVFYDKMKDLEKARTSEKRAMERDSAIQLGLFDDGTDLSQSLQVLRMEIRLGTRAKIRSVIKQLDLNIELTFAALFDASIAKDVVLHYWRQVRAQLPLVACTRHHRPEDLFAALAEAAGNTARPAKLLQQLGMVTLVGSVGMRGMGALMSRHCSTRSWQRYKREAKALPLPHGTGFNALDKVDETLRQFDPLRLSSFKASAATNSAIGRGASD